MEGLIYILACGAVAFFAYIVVQNTIRKQKEEKESQDKNKEMRELELKLLNIEILTAEKFAQLQEQEKARIQKDWDLVWETVKARIVKTAYPEVCKLVKTGMSSIGVFESVMNNLQWDTLLESAIPQIPPSGRTQINELLENMIDNVKKELGE